MQLRLPTCVNMVEQRRRQATLSATEGDLQLVASGHAVNQWLLKNHPFARLCLKQPSANSGC